MGTLTSCFGHETIGSTNVVVANAELLNKNIKNSRFMMPPDLEQKIFRNIELILSESEKVETFAKFALQNVTRDKRTRKKINIIQIVNPVLDAFEKIFTSKNIQIQKIFPNELPEFYGFPIDWESIFINLITNSIWAMESIESSKRIILIKIDRDPNSITIHFSDSGIGLEKGTEDEIFYPTFSTKRNRKGDLIGTGMGLAIVKNFIDNYNGRITALSPSQLGGAEFIISIPTPRIEN